MFREEVAEHYRARGYTIREDVKVRGESGAVHRCDMVAQSALGNLIIAFEDAGGFEGPEMNHVRRMAQDIGATPVVAVRTMPPGVGRWAAQAGVVLLDEARLRELPEPEPGNEASAEPDYPPWPGSDDVAEDDDGPAPWPRTARSRPQAPGPLRTEDLDDLVQEWSERSRPAPRPKSTDPGFWNYPRSGAEPAPPADAGGSFAWLKNAGGDAGKGRMDRDPVSAVAPVQAHEDASTRAKQASGPQAPEGTASQATPASGPQAAQVSRTSGPRGASRQDVPAAAAWSAQASTPTALSTAGLRLWHWFALAVAFGATAGGVVYALSALFG